MGALSSPPMCWIDKTVNVPDCVWINTFPLSPPVGFCFLFLFFFLFSYAMYAVFKRPFTVLRPSTLRVPHVSCYSCLLLSPFLSSPLTNTLRECVVDSEFLCDEMCSRKQTEIRIVFWVFSVCVGASASVFLGSWSLFVQYELSISASRRVWEEQIDPQTSRPRARSRRSLCRRGAVCISGSQSEAKQKQHPAFRLHFNTSFETENMEHSPENVERSLLLKMQRCVIQDPHQQKRRWEENIPQRRMN